MRFRLALLAMMALALGAFAWRDAAAAYWLAYPSSLPSPFVQSDPRVGLGLVERWLVAPQKPDANTTRMVFVQAQNVLRSSPLEPSAIRDIAAASEKIGQPDFKQAFLLAERVSRRDQATQRALLRIAASDGGYGASIDHLDKMLTVFPKKLGAFLPTMTALIADPEARDALSTYGGHHWFVPFLSEAIRTTPDPEEAAILLRNSQGLSESDRWKLLELMVDRLVNAGQYDAAIKFAVGFGRISPAILNDFSLTERTVDRSLGALGWQPKSNDVVQSNFAENEGLNFEVEPAVAIDIISRVTLLRPGRYILQQRVIKDSSSPDFYLQWQLDCRSTGKQSLAWSPKVAPQSGNRLYRFEIGVPVSCPVQLWKLKIVTDEVQMRAAFRIAEISLKPA